MKAVGVLALVAVFLAVVAPVYTTETPPRVASELTVSQMQRIYEPTALPRAKQDPIRSYAELTMSKMSLDQKIRSLLMLSYPGTDVEGAQFFMATFQPGGFILMPSNIGGSPDEVKAFTTALSSDAQLPVLIATDEEGGDVVRLPWDDLPGASQLRDEAPSQTFDVFQQRAQLLSQTGVTVNFGIVADIGSDPSSFIFGRTFGSDASAVSERVAAAVAGEARTVESTLKHFPGHGSVAGDSHSSIPQTTMTYPEWLSSDAVPFEAGMKQGADLLMFGHLSYSAVDTTPASLSAKWHSIARNDLGFTGVMVTDDLTMLQDSAEVEYADASQNAVRALQAGNDLLLYVLGADPLAEGVDIDAIVQAISTAVQSGTISEKQLEASVIRVLSLRRTSVAGADKWQPPCDLSCFIYPAP